MLFVVPSSLLLPVKLLALWFIEAGRPLLGLAVIIAAKLLGTALVGRLFIPLEPQLRQFTAFVRALDWWLATKRRVLAALHASQLRRRAHAARRVWRIWLRRVRR